MSLSIGARLEPYEILDLLGRGGMGEVYRARDVRLGRPVAIKILPPNLSTDPESVQRFEREARLASLLNHPNIVTIYDIGRVDSSPYIVMELVDGETLHRRLARGPLPVGDAIEIAAQVADGLAKAHEAGIVHRDLKPQNVMLTPDGRVKILDFGLSKLAPGRPLDDDAETVEGDPVTMMGRILGTVGYMSPEQVLGGAVGAQSDQFALGSLVYEMLTGKPAFRGDNAMQTLLAVVENNPEPITTTNPDTPPALVSVVERCLAKRPDGRYDSTLDLARELHRLLDQVHSGTIVRTGGLLGSHARWLLLAAAIVLVAVLAPVLARLPRGHAPPTISSAIPAQKHVAVLPFANVGADPPSQALSDGLVEVLTTKLTQLEQFQHSLQIVPASEVRRERITSAREARQAFAATLVINGSMQHAADRVRITLNLIDPVTLRQLKARAIDMTVGEPLVLQDTIVAEAIRMLELDVEPRAQAVLTAGRTLVPSAYDFYLQGEGYLQRFERVENVDSAIELFKRALGADATYALAHAALGEAYWRKYELTKEVALVEQARVQCLEALRIDASLAHVHVTLGLIDRGTGRYEEAIARLDQALGIDPMSGDAYRELARTYEALGRFGAAEATYSKAIEMRPGDWAGHNALGTFYASRSQYQEAAEQFGRVIELTPDNIRGYNNLGGIYFLLARYGEAAEMFERSARIRPNNRAYSNLGTVYFAQGRYAEAARAFERAVALLSTDHRLWRNLGAAYHWAPGERAKARAAYEKAVSLAEQERKVNPRQAGLLAHLADGYAMLGQVDRARRFARDAARLGAEDSSVLFTVGSVYEQLGDRRLAIEWVTRALRAGYSRALVDTSPDLAGLRADARFRRLNTR